MEGHDCSLKVKSLPTCTFCLEGKIRRDLSFPLKKDLRGSDKL